MTTKAPLALKIGENNSLQEQFGLLISGTALAKLLGYPSANAFRTAIYRGTVPIRMFEVSGRRGKFALTAEVETWLAELLTVAASNERQKGGKR